MIQLSKRFILIKVIFSLFLIISLSVLMPAVTSQPFHTLESQINQQKKNIDFFSSMKNKNAALGNSPEAQGLFDWLIMLLNFVITILESLVNLISNAIQLINLLERVIQVFSILLNAINQLIDAIVDLFTPEPIL